MKSTDTATRIESSHSAARFRPARRRRLRTLSVEVGLGVLRELLEQEVGELVGPKGKWNRERTAVRHGHEDGEVTLGGRRIQVKRPRARTADGESELPLATYDHFADRDQLSEVVLERMLAGVSTRQYRRGGCPVNRHGVVANPGNGPTRRRDQRRPRPVCAAVRVLGRGGSCPHTDSHPSKVAGRPARHAVAQTPAVAWRCWGSS